MVKTMSKYLKNIILVFLCMCIVSFTACNTENEFHSEDVTWKFSHIQSNTDGEIVYCSEENASQYSNAKLLDLSCTIKKGIITITENTTSQSWDIAYSINNSLGESIIYDVSIDSISGNAAAGKTTYSDGSFEYTFIISLNGYSLYFTD